MTHPIIEAAARGACGHQGCDCKGNCADWQFYAAEAKAALIAGLRNAAELYRGQAGMLRWESQKVKAEAFDNLADELEQSK